MSASLLEPNDPEYYLRQYLATRHEPTRNAAMEALSRLLLHPGQILGSPLLAEDHPLKDQALVIADAFEAVTNGMENPLAMEALESLEAGVLFWAWKPLIKALQAFYRDDLSEMDIHLGSIPVDSPLGVLAPLLREASGMTQPLTPREKGLVEEILDRDGGLAKVLLSLEEALLTGMEDQFFSLLPTALDALDAQDPGAAARLSVWAVRQIEIYDLNPQELVDLLRRWWGVAEGSRLSALGLFPQDPEAGLLVWMHFLLTLEDEDQQDPALGIFKDMCQALAAWQSQNGEGEDFRGDFDALAHRLAGRYPGCLDFLPAGTWTPRPASQGTSTPKPAAEPLQLELFAS